MEISKETFIKIKKFVSVAFTAMANIINGTSSPKRNDFLSGIRRIHINLRKEIAKG